MFKNIDLKSRYSTEEDDIVEKFYNPILSNAVRYDRTTAYFSSKALALYSKGLENFVKKGKKFRLIVSVEGISSEDFELIKNGYFLKSQIKEKIFYSLEEKISLEEEKNLSNLAYLISKGIVEIKFAFLHDGLFHEKCGIFYDQNENIIMFNGSLNETEAAISSNFESFNVFLSWINNDFYKSSILKSIINFENLWENKHKNIVVINADNEIINKIIKFNKNKIITDINYLKKETIILDTEDEKIFLYLNYDNWLNFNKSIFYKIYINPFIFEIQGKYIFLKEMSIKRYEKLLNYLEEEYKNSEISFLATENFKNFIKEKNLHLNKRKILGIDIKNKNEKFFEEFLKYKKIVDNLMKRKLRDQQIWDSFFMYLMKKSCNFSVPGSGKTSSVLGVFAILKYFKKVNKIIVVGPKNCFDSWIKEFHLSFDKIPGFFNIQDNDSDSRKRIKIEYNHEKFELMLFNYESLKNYGEELKKIIKGNELLVFDEIHRIKKINGVYSEIAIEIAKNANYVIAMIGTPIPNSYLDIFNILQILFNREYNDFFGFSTEYLASVNEKNKKDINDKLYPFFCRTRKEDLKVPKANDDYIESVDSNNYENELFKIIYFTYKKNPFELFIRLLQLESNPKMLLEKIDTSDFKDMVDDWEKDPNEFIIVNQSKKIENLVLKINQTEKKKRCINLVKKLLSENKKIIIWCIFKRTMFDFLSELNTENISSKIICGETNLDDRVKIIEDFKLDRFQVLITNPHTLAESISLHDVCHDAIYFEYSFNLVHLLQSKDRIHRLGLKDGQYTQWHFLNNFYIINNIRFSMGEKIYRKLKEKEEIMIRAIESNFLENLSSNNEDLEFIFEDLNKLSLD